MKIPIWKKWLSFLFEIPIERGGSEINDDLQLGIKKGRFCLSTPNAIYSYEDLYDNFSRSFQKMDIGSKPIENVLVLGYGLGSIPIMLEKVFHKDCNYVGIEADELIAFWASKYLSPKIKSPTQIIVADALPFVELCKEKFDLIAMDIFVDNVIPQKFESVEFLQKLDSLLTENGILMYNRLALRPADQQDTEWFYENKFKEVFPDANYIDLTGNWMLINKMD